MNRKQIESLLGYIDAKIEAEIATHESSAHDPAMNSTGEKDNAARARLALFESFGLIESFPYSGMTYDPKTRTGQVIEQGAVVWEQRL